MSACELKESLDVVLNFQQEEKPTILIVDDEENNLQLLKRTFRSQYNLLTASVTISALIFHSFSYLLSLARLSK